jgi:hypothetical protein
MLSWIPAAVSAVAACVALWILHRSRTSLKREVQSLQSGQKELNSVLQGFMEESEKVVAEFSRILSAERTGPSRPDAEGAVVEHSRPKPRVGLDKKHHVLSLARKGVSTNEIASQLMMPQGEIQLIVDLYRERTEESQSAGFA